MLDQRQLLRGCALAVRESAQARPGARHETVMQRRHASRRLFVSARVDSQASEAATLARAYEPVMPGPA